MRLRNGRIRAKRVSLGSTKAGTPSHAPAQVKRALVHHGFPFTPGVLVVLQLTLKGSCNDTGLEWFTLNTSFLSLVCPKYAGM